MIINHHFKTTFFINILAEILFKNIISRKTQPKQNTLRIVYNEKLSHIGSLMAFSGIDDGSGSN